eukprot:CAMPEP_0172897576 /NCGR_PEP_ID=MMETSP1075-20121228/157866_1 /TAXON_ID=2916 /ORGANISM="Ceratium fusus, Strain PA161109" /LENGTH=72 /DNA_ID=CAMNT_0013753191 /DNA_START=380 /DNA_END=595 /DNA_ORIENTATION=+
MTMPEVFLQPSDLVIGGEHRNWKDFFNNIAVDTWPVLGDKTLLASRRRALSIEKQPQNTSLHQERQQNKQQR